METQERILIKAHEKFMRYGIRSVSMDDIATHLGVSKKTIYQFYTDKDALVTAVFKLVLDKNLTSCTSFQSTAENAIHEQYLCSDMVQEMFNTMNPSIMYETKKYHPKAYEEFEKHKRTNIFNMIKANLERGIAEGLFREDIDVEIITWMQIESIALMFYGEEVGQLKKKLAQIEKEVTEFFLYGLATPKGLKLITKYKTQRQLK